MFHDELTLTYVKFGQTRTAGPTSLQGSENKIERDSSKAKQEEMTPEKNKSFVKETRNTEDGVLSFRGEGCNIPLLCHGMSCNFAYYCTSLVVELKAKAPPKTTPCGL